MRRSGAIRAERRIVVTSKLTRRGQTTVPANVRKALNAGRSARLVWYLESDGTVIVRAKEPNSARKRGRK
ncbi:type II toxin-antitoxin system PrlF family antitoxin [Paraburkholderia sediminicola]|uniref:type II toxin-antitoxin system PrlF family antitoxin n=1 Tax=Paraburkholderia sediminicola TaxID=458836 RepID=UPI0038BD97C9